MEITARRSLEHPQVKFGNYCQQVVEDIGLDTLIVGPNLITVEDIQFDRQSVFSRLSMPDQKGHALMDVRMVTQISFSISSKCTNVG